MEESQNTLEKVIEDRQYMIDAVVVRIMKMRKTLGHTELINEALTQLRVPIKVPELKRRIDTLIEREYMKRDEQNQKLYHYLA